MREHMGLYRGKRIDNGEWVEGFYAHFRDLWRDIETYRIYKLFAETDCGDFYPGWYEVDPDTVGECTARRDNNGKLIFEGDVYQYFDDEIQVVEWYEETHNIGLHTLGEHEIKKGRKTEKVKFEGWNCLWDYPLDEMEYLGNIHDNPELLKGGEGE